MQMRKDTNSVNDLCRKSEVQGLCEECERTAEAITEGRHELLGENQIAKRLRVDKRNIFGRVRVPVFTDLQRSSPTSDELREDVVADVAVRTLLRRRQLVFIALRQRI